MRHSNRQTFLRIRMLRPDGALIDLQYSDRDVERKAEANKDIIAQLAKIPGFDFLKDRVTG